jgi:hypothetical protein
MPPREQFARSPGASSGEQAVDGLGGGAGGPASQLGDLLGGVQAGARAIVESEAALRALREQFERSEDRDVQEQLAAEALAHVEHQLSLARTRRRQLDGIEGKLWARRNRLEHFLIRARGREWWRERRAARELSPATSPS